jgi:hypothetical protein
MVTIAPQALASKPGGAAEAGRLGVHIVGLGGFGCCVVERLTNRFQGQPEEIGLHPTWVDAVRNDGYATSSGPFGLSYQEAEHRFLPSDGDYASVFREIANGRREAGDIPVTRKEAQQIAEAKLPPLTGFGGQPLPSFVASRLRYPAWAPRLRQGLRSAAAVDAAPPLTVVVASLYGGVGVGHVTHVLRQLRAEGVENVTVFLALPSQAVNTLALHQLPEAHARGIGVLRGLLRPELSSLMFLVGSGNSALVRDPRGAAIEVVASAVGAWLENPGAYRSELATWIGPDLGTATAADRMSGIGAAEIVFPAATLAQIQACHHAQRALRLVTEITQDETLRAQRAGTEFAWSDRLTQGMSAVVDAPEHQTAVAHFGSAEVVASQLATMQSWVSSALPETDPVEMVPLRVALEPQPHRVLAAELINLAGAWSDEQHSELTRHLREARGRHVPAFRAAVEARLTEDFNEDLGVVLSERPVVLRRTLEVFGTSARVLSDTAARVRRDLDEVTEQLRPIEVARDRLAEAEQALPQRPKIHGRRLDPEVEMYLDRAQEFTDVVALDAVIRWFADHLERLAAVCQDRIRALAALVGELEQHRQAAAGLEATFARQLAHLEAQATMRVVPSAPAARTALADELAHAAAGDVTPDLALALLAQVRVTLETAGHERPTPLLHWPSIEGFIAAAEERATSVSRTTGALAADGSRSVIAAAYLPSLAHHMLRPQYEGCTLADALAVDFARGWSPDAGGHADAALVRDFLDRTVVSAVLRASESTVELTEAETAPTVRRTAFVDRRPARGLACVAPGTVELVAGQLAALLEVAVGTLTDGAPGRASVVTVVHRIAWDRIREFQGDALRDYLTGTELPVHVDPSARRAHEIEQRATAEGLLVGRTLDPRVLRFLDDPDALRAFLGLVATGRMPTSSGDLLDSGSTEYQLDLAVPGRVGEPQWRRLGSVTAPLEALRTVYDSHDSERLRQALRRTWAAEQAKLLAHCGGDVEQARGMVRLAVQRLQLRPAGAGDAVVAADLGVIAVVDTL